MSTSKDSITDDQPTVNIKSRKNTGDGSLCSSRRENYFLLVSEFKDNDDNIINIPVYIEEGAQCNRVYLTSNKIATVFGKENFRDYINNQIKNKNLVRIKNKSNKFSEGGVPSTPAYENTTLTDSITDNQPTVNNKYTQKSENNTSDESLSYKKLSPIKDTEKNTGDGSLCSCSSSFVDRENDSQNSELQSNANGDIISDNEINDLRSEENEEQEQIRDSSERIGRESENTENGYRTLQKTNDRVSEVGRRNGIFPSGTQNLRDSGNNRRITTEQEENLKKKNTGDGSLCSFISVGNADTEVIYYLKKVVCYLDKK